MKPTPLESHSAPFALGTVLSLASIFCFRMLGLFIILPIFALYAEKLRGATPTLMGLALGIYGLTQAVFQIPLAMCSDKVGRKRVIVGGLALFILGSCVAGISQSIYGVIIGRALQGAGAIGSTVIALVADLTPVEHRTKAMAIIGMSIALSFACAMVIGPLLNNALGLSGIFWITAGLGALSMVLLWRWVPTPPKLTFHRDAETVPSLLKSILTQPELLRLDLGIFILHALLTASFIGIPLLLAETPHIGVSHTWIVYIIVMSSAFILVMPCIMLAEKRRTLKASFIAAILALCLTQIALWQQPKSVWMLILILGIFFTGFTFLEATLPSLISKIAPAGSKGTAIGVYSSAQFLGVFIGGSVGGWLFSHFHFVGIFGFGVTLGLIWLGVAVTMRDPPYLSTLLLPLEPSIQSTDQADALSARYLSILGVHEAAVALSEGVVYLKVDKKQLNVADLKS